jgi:hypothetical protein
MGERFLHFQLNRNTVRDHLEDRLRSREISKADPLKLMEWIRSNPEVPNGAWCKDFGAFQLVGQNLKGRAAVNIHDPISNT